MENYVVEVQEMSSAYAPGEDVLEHIECTTEEEALTEYNRLKNETFYGKYDRYRIVIYDEEGENYFG